VDADGKVLEGAISGNLCLTDSWPGMMRTVYGDHQRFIDTYFKAYPGKYFTGDGCRRDEDGYYWITGRVDDVINVAGHRLGTKELESAALTVPEIAEAAAVPVIDDIRGRIVEMYVSLKPGVSADGMAEKVTKAIEVEIGKIARPKNVWIVADMPKTRSGKIMRRVIASVSNFADVGDVTTLANPEVVETIRRHVQSAKAAKGETPRDLTDAERAEIATYGAAE